MRILAIDPGSSCGFAYRGDQGELESGTVDFALRRGESRGMQLWRFSDWLETVMFRMGKGDLVLFEMAHHRGGAANEVLTGMTTRIMEYAERRGAEYKGVHSGSLKKAVAGHGNADKDAMAVAVSTHLACLKQRTDDEYDALALVVFYDLGMPEAARKPKKDRAIRRELTARAAGK